MKDLTKQMYLIRGEEHESYFSFFNRIHMQTMPLLMDRTLSAVSYMVTEEAPPKFSVIPFKKNKLACITIKKQGGAPVEALLELNGFDGAYAVTEALPLAYKKTWPDGERTSGTCLLTLFKKKNGIDRQKFLDRWHNSHTPLSLKIHPLWQYNRNVVQHKLTDDSFGWDGIVGENFRLQSELLNPFKFFGNPLVIVPRMLQVYTDTNSFLDYKTIQPYLVGEYHLKS